MADPESDDVVEGERKVVAAPISTRVVEVDDSVVLEGAVVDGDRPVSEDEVGEIESVVDGPPASGWPSDPGATETVVGPGPSPVVGDELASKIVVWSSTEGAAARRASAVESDRVLLRYTPATEAVMMAAKPKTSHGRQT